MNEQPIARAKSEATQEAEQQQQTFDPGRYVLGFYNYSIIATLGGLVVSMLGICCSVFWQLPLVSVYCLLIAGAFHLFDGKIAKTKLLTAEQTAFGRALDLISDLSAFVLLPLAIGYRTGMDSVWFLPFMLVYLLAGVIRLTNLHVTDEERKATGGRHRQVYIGMPLSSITLILPAFFLLYKVIPLAFPWLFGVLMLLMAAGFLYRFKMRKFGIKGMMVFILIGIIEMVLLVL